jgi:hypothetical protein
VRTSETTTTAAAKRPRFRGGCARRGRFAALPWLRTVFEMRAGSPGATSPCSVAARCGTGPGARRSAAIASSPGTRRPYRPAHDARSRLAAPRDAHLARASVPREGRDRRRRVRGGDLRLLSVLVALMVAAESRASSRARRRPTSPAGQASGSSLTSATTSSVTSSGFRSASTSATEPAS